MSRVVGVALCLAVASTPVRAEEVCSTESLARRTAELLGRDPFGPTLRVEMTATEARVTIVDGDGVEHGPRIVTATSCDELIEAAAVVIAIAVTERERPPARVTSAPPPGPPVQSPPPPEPRVPSPPAPRPLVTTVRGTPVSLGAIVGGAISPSGRQRMSLGARVRRGPASLELDANLHRPEQIEVTTAARVDVGRTSATASPCLILGPASACALLAVNRLAGRGENLVNARTARGWIAAAGGRLAWEPRFSRSIAARIAIDVEAPLATGRFLVGQMPVWSLPPVEAWLVVAMLATIP